MNPIVLKLTFIQGLKEIVLEEIKSRKNLKVLNSTKTEVYLEGTEEIHDVLSLRSILNVYLIKVGGKLNPYYISNHKLVLGEIIQIVLNNSDEKFRTFRLSCAGNDSPEVIEIENYISETYKLLPADEADMDIFIGKIGSEWEIGVRTTTRPLSLRDYKVGNIKGGMNPSIAHALNSLCELGNKESYLNIFSGSATLLIEAGLENSRVRLVGFDIDKKSNSIAIQNITKAGLIKRITIKTANLLETIDFGKFDVITSDLPFGMQVGKGDDLETLYSRFVEYCEKTLNQEGVLATYTTEHELLQNMLKKSKFKILKEIELKVSTSVGAYIHPKIFLCKFR
jgi:tRNA (guanine6-N2)-methyltransferase